MYPDEGPSTSGCESHSGKPPEEPGSQPPASGEILVSNHGVPARIKRDWHSHQRHVVCQQRWRESAAAGGLALCRFVAGPEATLATLARGRAVPPGRLHPPIHIYGAVFPGSKGRPETLG